MSTNEPQTTRRAERRRSFCVVIAASPGAALVQCAESVHASTPRADVVIEVEPSAAAVQRAIEQLSPHDVIVLDGACRVGDGWAERLRGAAYCDTNVASASALASTGTPLALLNSRAPEAGVPDAGATEAGTRPPLAELQADLASRSLALRPRISRAVGPCVYLRRDALELVGALDERLDLPDAIELDLAQRCVLSGMTHVAADDVVVEPLGPRPGIDRRPPALVRERYPYLTETPLADSAALAHALAHARGAGGRLGVTFDARALDGSITGTHVHVIELILALARTDALALRVLVRRERIDDDTRALLEALPATELLAIEDVDARTARTAVFHRPQQTFSPSDVRFALSLGERFVVSQLDLIAYRNPGYFEEAATWEDYRAASRHGLSAAERVVVFSEHTREELLADGLVEPARIRIVPPGLDHRRPSHQSRPRLADAEQADDAGAFGTVAAGAQAADPLAADDPLAAGFLLCLGTDFRHKNRVFALRLLEALRERHGWRGRLVLAGAHVSPGSSAQLEAAFLAARPALADAVVSLGPVSEPERAWLIARAGAMVYPSVYEGFGLVPFESALSGVPCVFAPYASLAELAPPGTATIVPWDAAASVDATHELLREGPARERHVQALADRAREFTWDAAAAATVAIYREAALAPLRDSATLSRDLVKREARLSVQHDAEVRQLIGEREHAKGMYDALNAEVGFGLSLIGPNGALPESVQRALLALTSRPAVSRPLLAGVSGVFVLMRSVARPIRALLRRGR